MSQDMLRDAMERERVNAFKTAAEASKLKRQLDETESAMFAHLSRYTSGRQEFVMKELASRGLTWCTCCKKVTMPILHAHLVFIDRKREESCGYQGGDYTFRQYENLYRDCPTCWGNQSERNGYHGPFDSLARDQEHFFVHLVEERNGSFYVKKGGWALLDPEHKLPAVMPEDLFEKVALEFNAPRALKFENEAVVLIDPPQEEAA